MPGYLLDPNATVLCMHAGKGMPTAPFARVTLGGQPVVTQAAAYQIAACPFIVASAPSPCISATWTTVATRVRAGGAFVLLQDSAASCIPNGTGITAMPGQVRVKGI